jgi:hypothetical protein
VEQQTASRAGGVDGLVEHDQIDLLGLDFPGDLRQVEHRTGEAVEPRNHELVAVTDEPERRLQFQSLSAGAA